MYLLVPSSRGNTNLSLSIIAFSKTEPLFMWLSTRLNSLSLIIKLLCFSSCVLRLASNHLSSLIVTFSYFRAISCLIKLASSTASLWVIISPNYFFKCSISTLSIYFHCSDTIEYQEMAFV